MTDRLPAPVRRITDTFRSFTPGQKAVTIAAVIALVVGAYFFATWASKPTYSILFNNLSTKDASAIVESLQKSGTKYELANDGQTILVPQDQVNTLRLSLSGTTLRVHWQSGRPWQRVDTRTDAVSPDRRPGFPWWWLAAGIAAAAATIVLAYGRRAAAAITRRTARGDRSPARLGSWLPLTRSR